MLKAVAFAATAAVAASAGGLRQLQSGGWWPIAPVADAATALFSLPSVPGGASASSLAPHAGHFADGVVAISGGAGQVNVAVTFHDCDNGNAWIACAIAPVFATAVITDASYAPRAAAYLARVSALGFLLVV